MLLVNVVRITVFISFSPIIINGLNGFLLEEHVNIVIFFIFGKKLSR